MEAGTIIRKSKEYIEKHIDEVLTVAKIAGTVGYSEYHFSRIFRQETGVSVMEYVKSEKLRRASGDIRNGAKIVDTAVKYGWESHNGFTKAFKKEFGYCPALLRAMVMSMKQLGGKNMNEGMTGRPEEHAEKQMLFEKLKERVLTLNPEEDVRNLEQIYLYACQIYQGMKRYSGDEYITHPLHTALLLADMEAEPETILAGLFCDALKKTEATMKELRKYLPEKTADLIEAKAAEEADMETDLLEQVTLLRLAERLHNMKTIEWIDEEQRKKRAAETMEIFLPLAEKTGNHEIAEELKTLAEENL
ncbi:AraC family transcriptional regulator [Drancourtella sp. An57]|uniref:helix-turn-helix domain-containing protein n=1 Tax=Drancourtella sp. An57 TaxID=1965647 RepID=UPI0013020CD7|nr:AraC family transcriptional regulator [Drancourtella sp. An57]